MMEDKFADTPRIGWTGDVWNCVIHRVSECGDIAREERDAGLTDPAIFIAKNI